MSYLLTILLDSASFIRKVRQACFLNFHLQEGMQVTKPLKKSAAGLGEHHRNATLARIGCIALNAGISVMVLHLLLANLPRSFTLGE